MPRSVFTPDFNPSTVSKTLEHSSPHTAAHLNRITSAVIGGNRVLYGLAIVQGAAGIITLMPGAFLSDGVIVTLKIPIELSYEDLLVDDLLPHVSDRNQSIILYGYCEDAGKTTEISFGFVSEVNLDDVTSPKHVHIATRVSRDDLDIASDSGLWSRVYGFSGEDIARDLREGVQVLGTHPFSADSGLRFTNPPIPKAYFTKDAQLLVFADRFLIPSARMAPTATIYYGRSDVRHIAEHLVSVEAFDYDGAYGSQYNLLPSKWGFVVSRDIAWHETYIHPGPDGEAAVDIPNSKTYLPGSNRLVVFENGLPLPPDEVEEIDANTLNVAWVTGAVYDFVCFNDVVFREVHSLLQTDLDQTIGGQQDVDLALKDHLIDVNRQTVLVFARVTAPGDAAADGGYIQVGRTGTATRTGQAFTVNNGAQIIDGGTVRLRGVEMTPGTAVTVVLLCVRGSTGVGVGETTTSQGPQPFHMRWRAVAGVPGADEIRACPHLDAFIYEAPGASGSVKVALNDVTSGLLAEDSTVLAVAHFEHYTLEQGPTFDGETSSLKGPRRVTASAVPTYGAVTGFSGSYPTVTLTVDGGAPAAQAGSPVRLRAGRLIDGLPKYAVGLNKLRLAVDGRGLVSGVDFDELTDTSVVLRVGVSPGQYVEAWVE